MLRRIEPEPFVARINYGLWPLSLRRPHAPKDRLETEASFVFAPRLDLLIGVLFFESLDSPFQLFLNSACSPREARRLFRGRGVCKLKPSLFRARQPVE